MTMPEHLDAEQRQLVEDYDRYLDLLAHAYDVSKAEDGANEEAALGGVGMALHAAFPNLAPASTMLICLAARRIARHRAESS